jgi:hypothetical protein
MTLWFGSFRKVVRRFDLRAPLLICVHLRSNFYASPGPASPSGDFRFSVGRPPHDLGRK